MPTLYWVGGPGTWDGTTGVTGHWSTSAATSPTIPATGTAYAPTKDDDVIFDRLGIGTSSTVNIATGAICKTVSFTNSRGTFVFGSSNSINVTTSDAGTCYTGSTSATYTGNAVISITGAATGTRTITAGAVTEPNTVSFNISNGTSTSSIVIGGNIKNLTFSGNYAGSWDAGTATNIYGDVTLNSNMVPSDGLRTRAFVSTGNIQKITSNGVPIGGVVQFNGSAGFQLQDNLTIGYSTKRTHLLTAGTLDLNNKTLNIFGYFSGTGFSTRGIAFGSSGLINFTTNGTGTYWDFGTLTSFTRTGTPNVSFTGTNTTSSTLTVLHGTSSGGTEDNSMSFTFDSNPTVNLSTSNKIYDLGIFGTWGGTISDAATNNFVIYGSYYGYGNPFGSLTFKSTKSGTRYLPKFSGYPITIDANYSYPYGGSSVFKLQDNTNYTGGSGDRVNLKIISGTFSTNGYTLECAGINFVTGDYNQYTPGRYDKQITFDSIVNIKSTTSINGYGFVGDLANTILDVTNATFKATNKNTVTFNVPNLIYSSVNIDNADDSSAYDFNYVLFGNDSTTIQTVKNLIINNTKSTYDTVFKIFSGSTLNVENISIAGQKGNGGSNNYVSIQSSTPGSQATLNKTTGGHVETYYSKIKDIIGSGATWRSPTNAPYYNIDGTNNNNTNWDFSTYTAPTSEQGTNNFLLFF